MAGPDGLCGEGIPAKFIMLKVARSHELMRGSKSGTQPVFVSVR